jgi:hypothetical protein
VGPLPLPSFTSLLSRLEHRATNQVAVCRAATLVAVLGVSATSGWACTLDTRLEDELGGEGRGDAGARRDGPGAAPFASLVEPPPGAEEIPRNLAEVTIAFSGPLRDPAAVPLVLLASGRARPIGPLLEILCDAPGACYAAAVALDGDPALPPLARIEVRQVEVAWLADGDPAAPGVIGRFVTSADPDRAPPRTGPARLEPATDCVRLRLRSDEPTRLEVHAAGREAPLLRTTLSVAHDWAFRVPPAAGRLGISAWDRAGNATPPAAVVAPDVAPGPTVVITEVHANPAGPEGVQEFVELANAAGAPVSLAGHRLEDSVGADDLPSAMLAPGARLLVVPQDFDGAALSELRPGTELVRVDVRLGKDGLSGRERVTLRAPDGTPVSSYGGWVDMGSTRWSGTSTHRRTLDACDHPTTWSTQPTAPSPGY